MIRLDGKAFYPFNTAFNKNDSTKAYSLPEALEKLKERMGIEDKKASDSDEFSLMDLIRELYKQLEKIKEQMDKTDDPKMKMMLNSQALEIMAQILELIGLAIKQEQMNAARKQSMKNA